jgi:hypothetical protein
LAPHSHPAPPETERVKNHFAVHDFAKSSRPAAAAQSAQTCLENSISVALFKTKKDIVSLLFKTESTAIPRKPTNFPSQTRHQLPATRNFSCL